MPEPSAENRFSGLITLVDAALSDCADFGVEKTADAARAAATHARRQAAGLETKVTPAKPLNPRSHSAPTPQYRQNMKGLPTPLDAASIGNDAAARVFGKLEAKGINGNWKLAPAFGFLRALSENLAPRNAVSRTGQIVTHAYTDAGSGIADLVGAHGAAKSIRDLQQGIDSALDRQMSPEMRAEYQENKTGRVLGEIGSTLLPLGGPAKLVKYVPLLKPLVGPAAKANSLGAKGLNLLGIGVRKMPLSGKTGRIVGKALQRANPGTAEKLFRALGLAGHVRGQDLSDRRTRDLKGDINPLMQAQDWINEQLRRDRTRRGDDFAKKQNLPMMRLFSKRYRKDDGKPVAITRNGKKIYLTGDDGRFLVDENGEHIPLKALGAAAKRDIERAMSDAEAHAKSKVDGAFSSGVIGKYLLNREQSEFADTPGFVVDPKSGKLVDFVAYPRVNDSGEIIKKRAIGGRLGNMLGIAGDTAMYLNPYTSLPVFAADMHDMLQRKEYGGAAGMAALMGSNRIPGLKQLHRFAVRGKYLPKNYPEGLKRFLSPRFYGRNLNIFGRHAADKGIRYGFGMFGGDAAQEGLSQATGGAIPSADKPRQDLVALDSAQKDIVYSLRAMKAMGYSDDVIRTVMAGKLKEFEDTFGIPYSGGLFFRTKK